MSLRLTCGPLRTPTAALGSHAARSCRAGVRQGCSTQRSRGNAEAAFNMSRRKAETYAEKSSFRSSDVVARAANGAAQAEVLERFWQEASEDGDPSNRVANASEEEIGRLAAESGLRPEQVQRWLSRRLTASSVAAGALPFTQQETDRRDAAIADQVASSDFPSTEDATEKRVEFGPEPPPEDFEEPFEIPQGFENFPWGSMSDDLRIFVKTGVEKRKPVWLKINGKETGKGEIWDGEWYGGNSEAPGWEGMPDTAALPRLPDGSLVQYTNILTKEEWDPTFLPVDLEPEPDDIPDEQIIKFQELPGVPEEEDVVQWFMNWRAEGRIGFDYLKEGMELEGVVTEQHLYFGCVVDCGCEFEGLAWIDEDDWTEELGELIEVGTKVRVRVSGLFDRERFRFPLELQIVSPDITDYITYGPPDDRPMIFYADESDDVWEEEMYKFGREPVPDPSPVDPASALGLMDGTGLLAAAQAAAAAREAEEAEYDDDDEEEEDEEARKHSAWDVEAGEQLDEAYEEEEEASAAGGRQQGSAEEEEE